jgi:hypothetical protein
MDSSSDNTTPVLALIPFMYPIGYGCPAPMGDIDDLDTKALLQNCHNINLAWSNGVEYLIDNTNGESIHNTGPAPTTFCDTYVSVNHHQYWKAYLTNKVWTKTKAMTSRHDDFEIIKNEVGNLATHLIETYISTNDHAYTSYAPPSTNNS